MKVEDRQVRVYLKEREEERRKDEEQRDRENSRKKKGRWTKAILKADK